LFLVGVALYWAEGSKDKPYDRREQLMFINSDPTVITIYVAWLAMLGVGLDQCAKSARLYQRVDGWWRGITFGATSGTIGR
jgi:hypothetical protein